MHPAIRAASVLLALLVAPLIPPAGASTPLADSGTLCGTWARPDPATPPQGACGRFEIVVESVTCGSPGGAYECEMRYRTNMTTAGWGCLFLTNNLPSVVGSYYGQCTRAAINGWTVGNQLFRDVPAGGLDFAFETTVCISYWDEDQEEPAPVPGMSECETRSVGTFHVPGPDE